MASKQPAESRQEHSNIIKGELWARRGRGRERENFGKGRGSGRDRKRKRGRGEEEDGKWEGK